MRASVVLIALVALLSGCASGPSSSYPSASPAFTPQASTPQMYCERGNGVWNARLGICEVEGD
jgi:hypothetical protein